MTITIAWWAWPILLTILTWVVAILWPVRSSGGAYDFGGAFDALVHLVIAVVVTLGIWIGALAGRLWAL